MLIQWHLMGSPLFAVLSILRLTKLFAITMLVVMLVGAYLLAKSDADIVGILIVLSLVLERFGTHY